MSEVKITNDCVSNVCAVSNSGVVDIYGNLYSATATPSNLFTVGAADALEYSVKTFCDSTVNRDVLPNGVKTILKVCKGKYNELFAEYMKNGYKCSSDIIPDIEDINVIVKDRVIAVTFADGTIEKAAVTGKDVFSLENAFSICITKKLLSDKSNGNGSNLYNKIIDRAMKKYNKIQKDKKKAEEQKKAAEAKYQKTVAKKAAKRAKREAAAREEKINIQKEAIIRAMKELNSSPADVSV